MFSFFSNTKQVSGHQKNFCFVVRMTKIVVFLIRCTIMNNLIRGRRMNVYVQIFPFNKTFFCIKYYTPWWLKKQGIPIRDGINTIQKQNLKFYQRIVNLGIPIRNSLHICGSQYAICNILPNNFHIATVWLQRCSTARLCSSTGTPSQPAISHLGVQNHYCLVDSPSDLKTVSNPSLRLANPKSSFVAFGLSSYLDSPALSMDLKLYFSPRENRPNNNY